MSSITTDDIRQQFFKNTIGLIGIGILLALIITSLLTAILIPIETFKEWNNPGKWIGLPKSAIPEWVNVFSDNKIPKHQILTPNVQTSQNNSINLISQQFVFQFDSDDFPNDFIYEFSTEYYDSPLLKINIIRPDGNKFELLSSSLPYSEDKTQHHSRIFSTDNIIKKNVLLQNEIFAFDIRDKSVEDIIFSHTDRHEILKGNYLFEANLISIKNENRILESKLIIGGKSYGLMGTDELRRDLSVGLLWGTPLALFIGVSVAVGSVIMGLIYGVYSGFKGKITDDVMMRFNDVIYALPALPFLIILAVTISNSIFLMIGFLMIFSWVGIAKVSRSMALQIKTRQYVEASKIMGQKNSKIIFKHIIPQLLPYAFASIAISVPAAITTEAGLSFLGLGDPTFPTWGQILHDANTFGAAAQGLWWWIIPPGLLIAITGLSFVFIGNALDVIINPRLKR